MPPRRHSRHTFTSAFLEDNTDDLVLTEPEPFRFKPFRDNRIHVVKVEDSLFNLAARFFRGLPRPAGLFWIIMDFQPQPIHDPTIRLTPGTVLVIPSVRTVVEEVFSESRRDQ
jgi:hypothetical protein